MYNGVATSAKPKVLSKKYQNYTTRYFTTPIGTGYDMRVQYDKLSFTGTGGGEVIRAIAEANGTLCATGGTINAGHFTGRVAAAKTVSGALNALRATLEVAGTTPTPGGTLAALQLDSNIVTGATMGAKDAFIRVSDSGATQLANFIYFEDDDGGCTENTDGTYSTADGYIKIYVETAGAARIPYFLGTDAG
jgi:hypothetical protein